MTTLGIIYLILSFITIIGFILFTIPSKNGITNFAPALTSLIVIPVDKEKQDVQNFVKYITHRVEKCFGAQQSKVIILHSDKNDENFKLCKKLCQLYKNVTFLSPKELSESLEQIISDTQSV